MKAKADDLPPLLPRDDRTAEGLKRRDTVPLASHADIGGGPDRDPIAPLQAQDKNRVADLVPIRWGRMSESPFSFYRGAAALMASDLSTTQHTHLNVQLCGDAHLSNFGMFASPDRRLVFDVNDFDETVTGSFEFDIKRLAASVAIAGSQNGLSDKKTQAAVTASVAGYRDVIAAAANADPLDVWYLRVEVDQLIAVAKAADKKSAKQLSAARRKATSKDRLGALNKLTEVVEGKRRIRNQPPLIRRLEPAEREQELGRDRDFLKRYLASVPLDRHTLLARYRLTDVALKVVGVGSVGTRCLIALFESGDDDPLILQVKEATDSVLEPYLDHHTPGEHGRRVVDGQRLIQSAADEFLGWSSYRSPNGELDYYVRQLWDDKGSLDPTTMGAKVLTSYANICGSALARAHARSGDAAAISGYIGGAATSGDTAFTEAIGQFAVAYAERNKADHALVVQAINDGKITVVRDL